ncbi:unnamed protein product [Darwinula stevensoni]|uniref:CUE domain-containing protein n=1 Tax=Darwinula stevensoni TaxID=69355 RepID=A0A7R9FQ32_9CRUS|nr:unnamed protein product [Darwinula stevensoni]CAG0898910.1 unnamed protein product [Darwinula stevensoni]
MAQAQPEREEFVFGVEVRVPIEMNNAAQLQQPRQPSQQQPTVELEFNQAMMDFKTMFPEVEAQVIEAVLRANDGVVDATIDQLLTMTSDSQKKEASPVNFTPSDPEELPLRVLRNWNPPLLGPLPHDFLRIRVPRLHQSQRQVGRPRREAARAFIVEILLGQCEKVERIPYELVRERDDSGAGGRTVCARSHGFGIDL